MDNSKYTGKEQTLAANVSRTGEIVATAARGMKKASNPAKVSLGDLDRVNSTAMRYVEDCASCGILPTVRGLAAELGVSRIALYEFAKMHNEFAKWLEDFSDLCGEVCAAAALEGTVSAVPAIFILKSRYGWRDTTTLEIKKPESPLGDEVDAETIAARYADLPSD